MARKRAEIEVAVITGLSGAGRSEAANALEDLGWFVIDNLPPALIDKMLSLVVATGETRQVALVIDARGGEFFDEAVKEIDKLRGKVEKLTLVFLEASDDVLVRRFELNRRRHPLAAEDRVLEGIRRERSLMAALRDHTDLILDTSDFSVRDLRTRVGAFFEEGTAPETLRTTVMSFGYKFGLPVDADLVFDVRFLPNPYWVPELKDLSGEEDDVRAYVMQHTTTGEFLKRLEELLDVLLPGYQSEGRHYLAIAVGCTGGRHRSVVLADAIARAIEDRDLPVKVIHRDLRRAGAEP